MRRQPLDLTAADAARRLSERPGMIWLDGSDLGGSAARYSYVGSDPVETTTTRLASADPLAALRALDKEHETEDGSPAPQWIGFVAFDAYWHLTGTDARRTAARHHTRNPEHPAVWFGRYDAVAVFDRVENTAWIEADGEGAAARLRRRLELPAPTLIATVSALSVEPATQHRETIRAALHHIAEGDIYQVNLARRWRGQLHGHPLALYDAMRKASPVPLGAYLQTDRVTVLARTMETFLHYHAQTRVLSTRPIKGTIARAGADAAEASALRADPKERAEHTMIVDLMRNDLGRLAEIGSVRVDTLMEVERYAKLAHLVSTVSCRLPDDCSLEEVFRATFPPGSVTGTPKIRALEIIEALESHPRGVYCGTVGYVARNGDAHFAVAIRTAQASGSIIDYHAGGGVVAASEEERELRETELKARVFLDAVRTLDAR